MTHPVDPVDCLVFGDQLDALAAGRLPDEARIQLLEHARTCASCAGMHRVERALILPSLETLEEQVPEEAVRTMYARVRQELGGSGAGGVVPAAPAQAVAGGGTRGRWSVAVPLLVAASAALLLATGVLTQRLRDARDREARLELAMEVQRARFTRLSAATRESRQLPRSLASLLAGRDLQESVTVAELRQILDAVPARRVIVSETRRDLLRGLPLSRTGRAVGGILETIPGDGGIRAGDLLQALDQSGVHPDLTFRTAELVDLLS